MVEANKKQPVCIIIAGPNGAGKTTFAREYLPNEVDCPVFVNADLIAAGLSPFDPGMVDIRAGALMLEEIALHVRRRESFAFETTLSGRLYAKRIPRWQELGFRVKLIYLCMEHVMVAIERVRVRVRQGGHDVPEDVIRRRFLTGWSNFNKIYKRLVDTWVLFDNSGERPVFLDTGGRDENAKEDNTG
jgi:predicted ABC-type ATPase